ncbi:GatB/YqeY domain-containing protein [Empedobacter falsenii]|uniref:GatB/YqeY domain-containing protein n=2 Tax=Empedobacter TaxID=59734 RepID=A0ABY8V7U1_9FLAO|nr:MULTISPECIES: GatB/YqeY domain-containing protein [Empedobacter]MCA4780688.1 GatB/YqeY domain-containing protein [Empedobacter stercoris]MCA4809369.1 GatB/YqeY domain-containing protein [Empedobacter stercoris]NOJ74581.1 GatB/YqeY domain-containing protein [Empedobacter stercoris]QNT14836.1 GatB/YqeY domain-containing protein [Empedobacter stercoris]WIH96825.1 GatB/YqeY domain-containing protein [Empedobacter falsenii]
MNLETQIMAQLKEAMKAKNTVALEALRAVKSELLLAKTSGANGDLSEDQEIALLQKLVKQRKEAAEQFEANGRVELAEKELAQAEVIQQFLPAQLTDEELTAVIQEIVTKVGATSPKDMGKVMGAASSQLAGKAEGKLISAKVKDILASL